MATSPQASAIQTESSKRQPIIIPKSTQPANQIRYHAPDYHPRIVMIINQNAKPYLETRGIDPEEVVERVETWFRNHYSEYPVGIEGFEWTEEGMVLLLSDEVDASTFTNALTSKGYEVEINEETGQISVYQTEKLSEEGQYKHKVGISYEEGRKIPLGGSFKPIWSNMEFQGDVVEETFKHILIYLEYEYGRKR